MKTMTSFPIKTRVRLSDLDSTWRSAAHEMDMLGQCDCDCASDCACAPEETSPHHERLPFKNHEKTLGMILGGGKYYLLDAPAGYGKSRLLEEVETRLGRRYHCLRIDLKCTHPTRAEIYSTIAAGFGLDLRGATDQDAALCGALSQYPRPFLLMLDSIERDQDGSLIRWFYNSLIKPLHERRRRDYKIILAGRHIRRKGNPYSWEDWRDVELKKERLCAIRISCIKELLGDPAKIALQENFLHAVAENIAWLSGGHPGIIEKLIRKWIDSNRGPDFSPATPPEELKRIFGECIQEDAREMVSDLDGDEKALLPVISVFCQMNQELIQQLCEKQGIGANFQETWSKITSRNLFVRGDVFWRDGVVRQVKVRELEIMDNDKYRKLHRIALELWEALFSRCTDHDQRVNALRNVLYHAINSGMAQKDIAQRIADDLRSIHESPEQSLALYQEADFKDEDLDDEHRWFEYLEIRHKVRPSAEEIRLLLQESEQELTALQTKLPGVAPMDIKIESNLLDALARALDFLRQNAEHVLIERWEKRNQGRASTPPVFKYSNEPDEVRVQEIKQSLQSLPAIPSRIKLADDKVVLLTPQYLQNLQKTMKNAQDSMGRLSANLALLASLKEQAELEQQIDDYKEKFNDAAAELAEIYAHLYGPQQ